MPKNQITVRVTIIGYKTNVTAEIKTLAKKNGVGEYIVFDTSLLNTGYTIGMIII